MFDFNSRTITLPSALTKNKREHTFPFGRMAEEVLRQRVGGGLLFLNGTRSPGDDSEKFLEQASSLWLSYKNGLPHEKRHLLKIATSNLLVDGKNIVVELQQPFQIVALYRKLPSGAPYRDQVRTDATELARELWGYFVEVARQQETERRGNIDTAAGIPSPPPNFGDQGDEYRAAA